MLQDCWGKLHQKIYDYVNLLAGGCGGGDHETQPSTRGKVVIHRTFRLSSLGKSISIGLYSATEVDQNTGIAKQTGEASLRDGMKTKHGDVETATYDVVFYLGEGFGSPGAMVVKNKGHHEFFLKSVTVEVSENQAVNFDCNSWVYPMAKTNVDRLFFANTSYLPSQTPAALLSLRQEELANLRGSGRGQREKWDRVYDYDRYNDLGEPGKGQHHARPVLGGSKTYPYPRRCRTGRPLSNQDGLTEIRHKIINLDFYVPPDDRFSPVKLSEFITNSIRAVLHFVIPEAKSVLEGAVKNFESFDQVSKDLYTRRRPRAFEGVVLQKLKALLPEELHKEIARVMKENPIKFPIPQVIAADENAWRTDEEFGREMLAGLNPAVIRCLESFPPLGKGGKRSAITAWHVEENLDGLSIEEAMESGRIFILDHHDYLIPYLRRINEQGVCIYASRTLLFLRLNQTLTPLVIELSSPATDGSRGEINRVFLPATEGMDAVLWQLAKTHVAVNDSGHHQLISHWLHTHAAVEPFVIATRRQLSVMHPIYKLLDPHFKDTMHINSLARSVLLNAGGILEMTMYPGKFAMELSSTIYKNWRFCEQALPLDLLKRGIAVEDHHEPSGVRLRFQDYPFAADGLDVWVAIKTWVNDYCTHFYRDDASVVADAELRSWWHEVRTVGHGDKRDDDFCWLPLDSVANLSQSLTTLIWIASALHAAVNFGQYGYAGYPLNRPTRCRRFIPEEGTPEFAELIRDPDGFFLKMVPDRFTTTLGVALIEVLSGHTADEVYLGQRASEAWTDDGEVLRMFKQFRERLREVEKRIDERNRNPRLENRCGPARVPYMLLYPDTSNMGGEKGLTGRGIPNSVSI